MERVTPPFDEDRHGVLPQFVPPEELISAAEELGITAADVVHYARSLARWIAAGKPRRMPEEVARIHDELCQPCEHYAAGRCRKCHCFLAAAPFRFLVPKIVMTTEHCPPSVGKW